MNAFLAYRAIKERLLAVAMIVLATLVLPTRLALAMNHPRPESY
jgi:hypothetical protein